MAESERYTATLHFNKTHLFQHIRAEMTAVGPPYNQRSLSKLVECVHKRHRFVQLDEWHEVVCSSAGLARKDKESVATYWATTFVHLYATSRCADRNTQINVL